MMGIELIQNDWNWVDAKLFHKNFGTFQIFLKNPSILESPNDLKCYEWRLNDVNEYEIWNNVKYHEWLWWNCIENLYAPKDLEWPKVSQPFCRIWKKLQNMMKIELFLWLRDEMISSSKIKYGFRTYQQLRLWLSDIMIGKQSFYALTNIGFSLSKLSDITN